MYDIDPIIYKETAARIPGYQKLSTTELADGYCNAFDSGDEYFAEGYFAALVRRFWSKINKLVNDHKSLQLTHDITFDWLVNSILAACNPSNRAWRVKENVNAEQVINRIIGTRCIPYAYYVESLQKNQGRLTQCSLDDYTNEDDGTTVGDIIEDETASGYDAMRINSAVKSLINGEKIIEAIILDNIMTRDVTNQTKKIVKEPNRKYTVYSIEFKEGKLVKALNEIDKEYLEYFIETYDAPVKILKAAINDLNSMNNTKKYKVIRKTREYIQNNLEAFI